MVAGRESVIEYTSITKMEHGGGTRLIDAATKYKASVSLEMEYTVYLRRESSEV